MLLLAASLAASRPRFFTGSLGGTHDHNSVSKRRISGKDRPVTFQDGREVIHGVRLVDVEVEDVSQRGTE